MHHQENKRKNKTTHYHQGDIALKEAKNPHPTLAITRLVALQRATISPQILFFNIKNFTGVEEEHN